MAALATAQSPQERLRAAKSWMCQLQGLESSAAVQALARTAYPMLVVEPGTGKAAEELVKALRLTPQGQPRVLLAYVSPGEAEKWRPYWRKDWVAPGRGRRGSPDFLVTRDPDGWGGSYPVAYWKPEWKKLWLGSDGIIAQLARAGFDGAYLDWVEAYDEKHVAKAAKAEHLDPALEMIHFIEEIRAAGRAVNPGFVVIPQNAPELIDVAPERYAATIDGLAVEDTWFAGKADADWDSAGAGDVPTKREGEDGTLARLKQFRKYQDRGLPVFSLDYCRSRANAELVYREARQAGLVPLVSRVSLSKVTEF